MLTDTNAIRTYFAKLGLDTEIADIYLSLHANGPQSISALARSSGVERTRIYRLIDKLMASNLIELESHYKRGIIKAAPISNLQILINQRENELKNLQDELGLIEQVLARNSISNPATRIQVYHGPEGIKQMQWNLLRAKKDVKSIMPRPLQDITGGTAFFKRWAEKWNQGDGNLYLIMNDQFLKLSNAWHKNNPGITVKRHHPRLIDPYIYPINFGMDIYDDVVAYYNWHEGDVFGAEIYNKDISAAHSKFFDMLWPQAKNLEHDLGVSED